MNHFKQSYITCFFNIVVTNPDTLFSALHPLLEGGDKLVLGDLRDDPIPGLPEARLGQKRLANSDFTFGKRKKPLG
jgi:hypothetical protein